MHIVINYKQCATYASYINYEHYANCWIYSEQYVYPFRDGLMDTEKVNSIKHCHVDVALSLTYYSNPINCCCDAPEGGHKTWVHEQGLKTNQCPAAAMIMMAHSLNLRLTTCPVMLGAPT